MQKEPEKEPGIETEDAGIETEEAGSDPQKGVEIEIEEGGVREAGIEKEIEVEAGCETKTAGEERNLEYKAKIDVSKL